MVKTVVAAGVSADLGTVDPDGGLVVDSFKVEEDLLALPVGGDFEAGAEPHVVWVELLDAGETRLDAGGDHDLLVEQARRWAGDVSSAAGLGVGPDAVEVLPRFTLELGTRVLSPGVGASLVSPWCVQWRLLDLVLDGVREGDGGEEGKAS